MEPAETEGLTPAPLEIKGCSTSAMPSWSRQRRLVVGDSAMQSTSIAKRISPMLATANMEETILFYQSVLGFTPRYSNWPTTGELKLESAIVENRLEHGAR